MRFEGIKKYTASPEMIAKRTKGKLLSTSSGFMESVHDTYWNPVWGCRNSCPYCFARRGAVKGNKALYDEFNYMKLAEEEYNHMKSKGVTIDKTKLANRLKKFIPTFIGSNFDIELPETPQIIWCDSYSEIGYWKKEWIVNVINKISRYPQHIFQFLTKFPKVYFKDTFPKNCWLGISITGTEDYDKLEYRKFRISNIHNLKFIDFEPLFNEISIDLQGIDWVIIGAETGDRKEKIIPKKEWVENIVNHCRRHKIPVYLMDSLKDIYPEEIKEFPEGDSILNKMEQHYKKGSMVYERVNYLKK